MLRPRITPCLLVHNKGLVKTVKFKDPKYVGDPINAVKIFNEKEVDELIVLDIDATVQNSEPDYTLIKKLAIESRMPLCYGGGVTTVAQARKILNLGIEKVAISSKAISNPEIIPQIARAIGTQSVVVVFDVQKRGLFSKYELVTHNAKKTTGKNPVEFAKQIEKLGVGEIVINSVDQDGVMKGYDMDLVNSIRQVVTVPITVLGGAGSLNDIKQVIQRFGIMGVAAGSLFVFKGIYKAVLINYPSREEKEKLFQ
jgi:imidazole glycerol-phosphate synthase subunit HisF